MQYFPEWKIKKIIGRRWYHEIQNKAVKMVCGTCVQKHVSLFVIITKEIENVGRMFIPCIGDILDVYMNAKGIQKLCEILDFKNYINSNLKTLNESWNIQQAVKNIKYYIDVPLKPMPIQEKSQK